MFGWNTRIDHTEKSTMTTKKQQSLNLEKKSQDQELVGAEAAILRAAKLACRRAIETTGSVVIFRNGEIVREKDLRKIFPEENQGN